MFSNAPAIIGALIPVVVFVIPIIAILTRHQQRMAELYAQNQGTTNAPEVQTLRTELQEVKALLHQQTIVLDNLVTLQARQLPTPPAPVSSSARMEGLQVES